MVAIRSSSSRGSNGLAQIVVGAGLEAPDPILGRAARGQQQDRHLALAAQLLGQRQAVLARHHDVEHHEVEGHALGARLGLGGIGGGGHEIAVLHQVAVQQLAQPGIVVDHQDVRCLFVGFGHRRPTLRRQAPQQLAPRLAHEVEQHALEALHRRGAGALEGEPQPPLLQRLDLGQQRRPPWPSAAAAACAGPARTGSCSISPPSASRLQMARQGLLADAQHRAELGQGDARAGARSGTASGGRSRRWRPRHAAAPRPACS